ncbi:LacI family DNA-binding transcriptional regulator [Lactobacillus selangorensis]|nr:LacI family DNA-binding transcriptional regulator [Lactobacillus selangorensis]
MATLNDVAKLANVSKMTVSRVINHPDKVTDDLKELVYQAMRETNYHPNVAAKALVNNRTQIIKFLILEDLDITEPYYMKLLVGIAMDLSKQQFSLQLVIPDNIDIGDCDGYIITGMRHKDLDWIQDLKKPVVIFGENHYDLDFVDVDNKKGTMEATRYALEEGYEHFVFIGIDMDEAFEYSREAGYMEFLQERQMAPEIYRMANHSHSGSEFIQAHIDQFEPNTCFICASDRLGLGIERGLQACHKQIPDQYGVIGFDGVFLHQIASPRLTTVKQPEVEMGSAIAQMIVDKVNQNNIPQGHKLFAPELVPSESTR